MGVVGTGSGGRADYYSFVDEAARVAAGVLCDTLFACVPAPFGAQDEAQATHIACAEDPRVVFPRACRYEAALSHERADDGAFRGPEVHRNRH